MSSKRNIVLMVIEVSEVDQGNAILNMSFVKRRKRITDIKTVTGSARIVTGTITNNYTLKKGVTFK